MSRGSARKSIPAARWVAIGPLVALAVLVGGCATGEVQICPEESESMLSDGTVRKQFFRSVSDPTAGGVLSGKPPATPDRPGKMILLLDYSGSMFGGYGEARVAGCRLCSAGLAANGQPTRRAGGGLQPYYFEVPEFIDLLARWLDAATPAGSRTGLEVLLFNAGVWRLGEAGVEPFTGRTQLDFNRPVSTASSDQIAAWLRRIPTNPYTVDSQAPNTTESSRALLAAIAAVDDEAIVWLVTDNIVDVGGGVVSAEDARRNLEFYATLKSEPRIQMISAFPLSQGEDCGWMCGTSLLAYGMYIARFERPDSAEFHRLGGTEPGGAGPRADGWLWNVALRDLAAEYSGRAATVAQVDVAGVPLRLKPIDTEVLTLDFNLHVGQALKCHASTEYGEELLCLASVRVRNALRHQVVESATLVFSNEVLLPRKPDERRRLPWASAVCGGQMETLLWRIRDGRTGEGTEPIEIGPLPPLAETEVEVLFMLPPIHVDTAKRTHLADVAFTNRILLDGRLQAEIRDIRTSLFIDTDGLEEVYGAPELPAIFRGREQGRIRAEYPAGAVILNNGQLFGLLVLLGAGSVIALVTLVALRFQRRQYTVLVDGAEIARLSMPRLSRRALEIGGRVRASLRRGWGPAYRLVPRSGHRLRKDGTGWILAAGGEAGEEYRVEVRRGWSAARRSQLATGDGW